MSDIKNISFFLLKYKAAIAVLAVLVVGVSYATMTQHTTSSTGVNTGSIGVGDEFRENIDSNVQDVDNAVLGVRDAQGKEDQGHWMNTYQNAEQLISLKMTESRHGETTFTPEQRALNEKYRAYLQLASNAVNAYASGGKPDLTEMNNARAALN